MLTNLAHGSGGRAMHELIEGLFLEYLRNPLLEKLEDQAVFEIDVRPARMAGNNGNGRAQAKIAFTTDSYVVDPIFFPGGDIGRLAVNGTVNDLAMSGARPLYLSAGFILEEGFPIEDLKRILASMRDAAAEAGVAVVTGDTKVVQKGSVDKLFINTAGIGVIDRPSVYQPRELYEAEPLWAGRLHYRGGESRAAGHCCYAHRIWRHAHRRHAGG